MNRRENLKMRLLNSKTLKRIKIAKILQTDIALQKTMTMEDHSIAHRTIEEQMKRKLNHN